MVRLQREFKPADLANRLGAGMMPATITARLPMSSRPGPRLMRPHAPPLVLASASAARARLLAAVGIAFEQRPALLDEPAVRAALIADGVPPRDAAVALAELKAQRSARQAEPDQLVVGADQLLATAGHWFDKPATLAEARVQLEALAGRRHELWTAAVVFEGGVRVWHQVLQARLWMRACSSAFIDAYLDTIGERALESVGAYHLEGPGAQLFARVQGDHFGIQGLPLLELLEFLRTRGILPR